jgi:hypothetical protein
MRERQEAMDHITPGIDVPMQGASMSYEYW